MSQWKSCPKSETLRKGTAGAVVLMQRDYLETLWKGTAGTVVLIQRDYLDTVCSDIGVTAFVTANNKANLLPFVYWVRRWVHSGGWHSPAAPTVRGYASMHNASAIARKRKTVPIVCKRKHLRSWQYLGSHAELHSQYCDAKLKDAYRGCRQACCCHFNSRMWLQMMINKP